MTALQIAGGLVIISGVVLLRITDGRTSETIQAAPI
jgi:hypothetical protein